MQVQRTYKHKRSAKRALKKVFGIMPYDNSGMHGEGRFANGIIEKEGENWIFTIHSTYWGEASLKKAFKVGIDNI